MYYVAAGSPNHLQPLYEESNALGQWSQSAPQDGGQQQVAGDGQTQQHQAFAQYQQQFQPYPYAQYQGPGSNGYTSHQQTHFQQARNPPGSPFAPYDMASLPSSSSVPLSPNAGQSYAMFNRGSVDYSSQSPYRSVPFQVSNPFGYQQYPMGGQRQRYPTTASDLSSPQMYMPHVMGPGGGGYGHSRTPSQQTHFSQGMQPAELARGHLAQAKFRDAVGAYDGNARLPISQSERRRQSTGEQRLPRPPSHSPWALWVGNVPSDATHAELWHFFAARPPPGVPIPGSEEEREAAEAEAMFADEGQPKPNYNSVGIDSIHLISRSNCCFVNMASKRHLDHAINVSNGLSLRPHDPRCRGLVCRVRKKEDDSKTGVGAQRGRGMHQAWVKEQERLKGISNAEAQHGSPTGNGANAAASRSAFASDSASTNHSASTSSTTASFMAKHFPKRYFIVKVSETHLAKLLYRD